MGDHERADGQSAPGWEFRILGPLEVRRDGEVVAIGGQRQRALLALLLLNANRVVPTERLVDQLWGERAPPTATASLQNGIGHLRRALGAGRLETRPPGYVLRVEGDELDLTAFERVLHGARSLPSEARSTALRDVLESWRGPPLADFTYEPFAQSEIGRFEELRLTALEERIDADLELGRHGELVGELESLVADHPLRERLRGQLMLALYRSGRQAEALEAYRTARHALTEELGIEPTPSLQRLNASILRQDAALDVPGAPPAAVGDEVQEAARALLEGRVVIVVGPGVHAARKGTPLGPDDVAAHLVERFDCPPDERRELAHVAQYVAVTRGVGPLYDELHDLLSAESETAPAHTAVAALAGLLREVGVPQPVIVTTNLDSGLERALVERGELFDSLTYLASGRDRGKFVHVTADGDVRLVDVPNAYVDVPVGRRLVVVKVNGQVGLDPVRDRESFVVSEDDYISYLAQTEMTNVVPVTVAATLRRSHLLFLGYGLRDWTLRVFLQRVWPDERTRYRSWAVEADVDPLERDFWRQRGVDLVEADVDLYLERLVGLVRETPVPASSRSEERAAVQAVTRRELTTVLFFDVVGSTEQLAKLGDRDWRDLLDRYRSTIRGQLVLHRGTEIDTTGDGFLACFDGPARAIACARAVIDEVAGFGIDVRAGVHTGECERSGDKVTGIAVHIGSRIADEAGAREVLVSRTVRDVVIGAGLSFSHRGAFALKGVPGEWDLYAVEAPTPVPEAVG